MATNAYEGYQARLKVGEVVYTVEPEDANSYGALALRKATVHRLVLVDGTILQFPLVKFWPELNSEPQGKILPKGVRAEGLFTENEVSRVLANNTDPVYRGVSAEEMLQEDESKAELAVLLGEASIIRLVHIPQELLPRISRHY
jgi:hypothetical protein